MSMTPLVLNHADTTSTTTTDLISSEYLKKLFTWVIIWLFLLVGFIWMIDPYGVSPIQVNIPGINTIKSARANIDRLIKPFEVWRYQPKTIFLGTSRIHQSMDPSLFDGTEFAPAYNAAIPASTLAENVAHLEQYLKLDPNIKHLFVELFLYNFTQELQDPLEKSWKETFRHVASLQFSGNAFLDSIKTISANRKEGPRPAHITKGGNWVQGTDFNPESTFSDVLFARTVLSWDQAAKMTFHKENFKYIDRIVKLAEKHNIQLHFIVTPNYPWDDYRLLTLGYWPILEEWLNEISHYTNVVSFSQYNTFTEEQPHSEMQWWNDPTHFSLNMGRKIMDTYLGKGTNENPSNFLREVNPSTAQTLIAERRAGLNNWLVKNPDFIDVFNDMKSINDTVVGKLNIKTKTLILNNETFPIELGVGEIVFTDKTDTSIRADGFVVDELASRPVKQIIATIGSIVVAQGFPTAPRPDIALALGPNAKRSGFSITIPIKPEQYGESIRIFAITRDGRATQLASSSQWIDGVPISESFGMVKSDHIMINNKVYPIRERTAGSIELAIPIHHGYQINGWAADTKANTRVSAIIAAIGPHIIAKGITTIDREDIRQTIAPLAKTTGFNMVIPLNEDQLKGQSKIQLFALMSDGVASPLQSNLDNNLFKNITMP